MEKNSSWRHRLYVIVFEADTPAGRRFDVVLLWTILLSVFVVMLESVRMLSARYGAWLRALEWLFTLLFTVEYIVRIVIVRRPWSYVFSFLGLIDLLAILPSYLSLLFTGTQYLLTIRVLRLLRVFRILKLARYIGEAQTLERALRASRHKITVFLLAVTTIVVIMGTLMYIIEGPEHGFTSIPRSMYWSIVTLTTVGYGDIAPQTVLGQALASFIMIMGYAIIAVPTGIVTAEITAAGRRASDGTPSRSCENCLPSDHAPDARYCKYCGKQFTVNTAQKSTS